MSEPLTEGSCRANAHLLKRVAEQQQQAVSQRLRSVPLILRANQSSARVTRRYCVDSKTHAGTHLQEILVNRGRLVARCLKHRLQGLEAGQCHPVTRSAHASAVCRSAMTGRQAHAAHRSTERMRHLAAGQRSPDLQARGDGVAEEAILLAAQGDAALNVRRMLQFHLPSPRRTCQHRQHSVLLCSLCIRASVASTNGSTEQRLPPRLHLCAPGTRWHPRYCLWRTRCPRRGRAESG